MKVIDLSHNIENGMMIYPGDPEISISEGLVHERDYCHVDRVHLNSHTGTHIDAPFHFLPDGKTMTEYDASKFVLQGVAVDMTFKGENEPITVEDFGNAEIERGEAVVLVTGWYRYFGEEKYKRHPYISKEAAEYLVSRGVSIAAVDFLNVDSTVNEIWDAHPVLLGNDCLIVENINNSLSLEFGKKYTFSFLPLKVTGTDGSPIRAIAME